MIERPMPPLIVRVVLMTYVLLGQAAYTADAGSIEIKTPVNGAVLKKGGESTRLRGPSRRKGDHVHVYVDGEEIATLHRPTGSYTLRTLEAGAREICIKVVK